MAFWNDLRVVVAGGAGFLGSHVAEKLRERGRPQVVVARRSEYDLRQSHAVTALLRLMRTPPLSFNLATHSAASGRTGHVRQSSSTIIS